MLSYQHDPQLKKMFVKEIVAYRKAEQIIQGTYEKYDDGQLKGCAVGCSIHTLNQKLGKDYATNDHSAYEDLLGLPEWLARLEDTIFEELPADEAKLWPEKFSKAIPVGVDLEPVKWRFCAFVLKENSERVLTLDIADDLKKHVVDAIHQVLTVQEDAIVAGNWNESAAESAAESARSAVRSAAWSAAESAARSAVWSAAWSASYQRYAKELLRILKEQS